MTKIDDLIGLAEDTNALLREIRDALLAPPPEVLRDVIDDACPHPEEQRISLRTMGTRGEHWQCGVCGYVQQPA